MLGGGAAAIAIGALVWRENAIDKARRALQRFTNARDFDNVYTSGNDHKRN